MPIRNIRTLSTTGQILAFTSWLALVALTLWSLAGRSWTGLRTGLRDGEPVVLAVDQGSPAERAGIRRGDVLQRIGGRMFDPRVFQEDPDMFASWADMDSTRADQERLGRIVRRGEEVSFHLERHGGEVEVRLVPGAMPIRTALCRILVSNFCGFLWILVAILVARRRSSLQTGLLFAGSWGVAATFATMIASMAREIGADPDFLHWLWLANDTSGFLVGSVSLLFWRVFPEHEPGTWRWPRPWIVLGAIWIGLSALQFLRVLPGPKYLVYGVLTLGNTALVLKVWYSHSRSRNPLHRRQVQWVAIGCFAGSLPYLLLTVLPVLAGMQGIPQDITSLTSIAIPLSVWFAISRWKLLEVSGLFDRGLVPWASLIGLLVGEVVLFQMVSWKLAGSEILIPVQLATLSVPWIAWSLLQRLVFPRIRLDRLGMETLPPFFDRLLRGDPLPTTLGEFLATSYGTNLLAVSGPGGGGSYKDTGDACRWIQTHRDRLERALAEGRRIALGYELSLEGLRVPVEVQNSLLLRVEADQRGTPWILVVGPRWAPDWWTGEDVARVRSLLQVALPVGVAAIEFHQEESRRRARLEELVAERTRDVEAVAQRLRQALSAREDFLAQMGHELRSPLAAVLGGVEAVREGLDGPPTPAMVRRLSMAERHGRHLLGLIQDILDFTTGRAGKLPIHPVPCRLSVQLSEALQLAGPEAETIRVGRELDGAGVLADPLRLRQILTNLLSNALKYGGGSVEVTASVEADRARVEVSDRGPGIAPALRDRLFRPFESLSGGSAKPSTGLGLALSRQLALGMGGDLSYVPRPGGGSVFRLELPVAPCPAEVVEPSTDDASVFDPRSATLLVVDDEPDLLDIAMSYFGAMGWSVLGARTGPEALEILERERVQAMLTDLGLPGMDGAELVRRARAMPGGRSLAVAVLTGAAHPEDQERSRAAGADIYFVKPVLMSEVATRLSALVEAGDDSSAS